MGFASLMAPSIDSLSPARGPTSGGDLLVLRGTGFGPRVAVWFGAAPGEVVSVRETEVHVRTPAHGEATVDLRLANLAPSLEPIPAEVTTRPSAYTFLVARLAPESDLTRLIRTLLRALRNQVLDNVSLSVSADFDDDPFGAVDLTAIARLPSLVLSGPRITENRFYSSNELVEERVEGASGPEIRRRRTALTVDVEFAVTGASDRAVELLNMMAALATFFGTNAWLIMERDPLRPELGTVRWELAPAGELHTSLEGKDDVRAFSWGLLVRGFDIHEGLPLDLAKAVGGAGAEVAVTPTGGAP